MNVFFFWGSEDKLLGGCYLPPAEDEDEEQPSSCCGQASHYDVTGLVDTPLCDRIRNDVSTVGESGGFAAL